MSEIQVRLTQDNGIMLDNTSGGEACNHLYYEMTLTGKHYKIKIKVEETETNKIRQVCRKILILNCKHHSTIS